MSDQATDVIQHVQDSVQAKAPQPADAISTPAQLMGAALANGATVAELKTLMEMQLEWEANEARKAFVRAKAAFKANCPQVERTAYSQHNNFWHDTIAGIAQVCDPLLATEGLSYDWKTEQSDVVTVHFILSHVDGHVETTTLQSAPDNSGGKNSIQAIGSAVSYLERYTMRAGLGIAVAEKEEDDGHSAVAKALYITPEQAQEIHDFIAEVNNDRWGLSVMAWLQEKGLEAIEEIPAKHFKTVFNQIKKSAHANS